MFCVTLILFIGSGVKDCGGCVNHGTRGGDSKENSWCLSNAENCDERDKENGGNVKKGNHGGIQ